MRCRIARQISGMHSGGGVETHEITHRSGKKFTARGNGHVGIRIRDNGAAIAIDDLAIERGEMVALLLDDFERTGFSQVSGASTRNLTGENDAPATNEIGRLLLQIDLDRVGRLRDNDLRDGQNQSAKRNPSSPTHVEILTVTPGENTKIPGIQTAIGALIAGWGSYSLRVISSKRKS